MEKFIGQAGKDYASAKDKGGLGFRDLGMFNQAMLAKVSWRIVRNLKSLISKILRGRYFINSDFLNAPLGNNPSYRWRSIV